MIPSFWRDTKEHIVLGRPPKYENAAQLAEACAGYFQWCEDNFVDEEVLVSYQGITTTEIKRHPTAMTIRAMANWLGVTERTWRGWRAERPDLLPTVEWAEDIIYNQKFSGAAAGQFNSSLIVRDLGLADKSELTGKDGGPIETLTIDPQKLSTEALKEIMAARKNAESDDS